MRRVVGAGYFLNQGGFKVIWVPMLLEINYVFIIMRILSFIISQRWRLCLLREDICGYLVEREARGAQSLVLTGHSWPGRGTNGLRGICPRSPRFGCLDQSARTYLSCWCDVMWCGEGCVRHTELLCGDFVKGSFIHCSNSSAITWPTALCRFCDRLATFANRLVQSAPKEATASRGAVYLTDAGCSQ